MACDFSMYGNMHYLVPDLIELDLRVKYRNRMPDEDYKNLINKLKLQYAKQAFMKRIIGLGDETLDNIAIITTSSGETDEMPQIDISPAYDLDICFNFQDIVDFGIIGTSRNNKPKIIDVMREFKDIDGFREFVESIVSKVGKRRDRKLAIKRIIKGAYEESKAEYFNKSESKRLYIKFLLKSFKEMQNAYEQVYGKDKEYTGDNKGNKGDGR